jgi:predicted ATPase
VFRPRLREGTLEDLLGYLADKRLLVIFDELENAPYASVFIERLLRGSASVKILATSRRELGLNLEWVYHLSPLVRGEDARELFFRTAERKTARGRGRTRRRPLLTTSASRWT